MKTQEYIDHGIVLDEEERPAGKIPVNENAVKAENGPKSGDTIDKAITVYGKEMQFKKAIEELTELCTELARFMAESNGKTAERIAEEIADTQIVTEELIRMLDCREMANLCYEYKLRRLGIRMAKMEERNGEKNDTV